MIPHASPAPSNASISRRSPMRLPDILDSDVLACNRRNTFNNYHPGNAQLKHLMISHYSEHITSKKRHLRQFAIEQMLDSIEGRFLRKLDVGYEVLNIVEWRALLAHMCRRSATIIEDHCLGALPNEAHDSASSPPELDNLGDLQNEAHDSASLPPELDNLGNLQNEAHDSASPPPELDHLSKCSECKTLPTHHKCTICKLVLTCPACCDKRGISYLNSMACKPCQTKAHDSASLPPEADYLNDFLVNVQNEVHASASSAPELDYLNNLQNEAHNPVDFLVNLQDDLRYSVASESENSPVPCTRKDDLRIALHLVCIDQNDVNLIQTASRMGYSGFGCLEFGHNMASIRDRLKGNIRHCKLLHQEMEFVTKCKFIPQDDIKFPALEAELAMEAFN